MCSALLIHEREIEEADVSFTSFIRVSGARYHLPYYTDGIVKIYIYIVRMYSLSLQPTNLSSQHQPLYLPFQSMAHRVATGPDRACGAAPTTPSCNHGAQVGVAWCDVSAIQQGCPRSNVTVAASLEATLTACLKVLIKLIPLLFP